jgi:hypothetical protein
MKHISSGGKKFQFSYLRVSFRELGAEHKGSRRLGPEDPKSPNLSRTLMDSG